MRYAAAPSIYGGFGRCTSPGKRENLRKDNRVATLEAAKVEFEASCSSRCPPPFR
jgi:hypothetical protein